jgi:hypothetical protein
MRTFYALQVHRKDGSWHRHIMRGELPKVGDTVPATLTGKEVKTKVEGVSDSTLLRKERGDFVIEVHAEEV